MLAKPNVLLIDIETSLMEVYSFRKGDQYISHQQIKKDWGILAWAAKWLHDPVSKLIYRDQRKSRILTDDKAILQDLAKLLNEADYVISQNGRRFDLPKIKARLMLNGLEPIKFLKHIDLYKELRDIGFTSHSLDYLTAKFCTKYKKLSHKNFPGQSLWIGCANGDQKAWEEMETYNIHDVLSLEELFDKTKKWLPKVTYELGHPIVVCPKCGGKSFKSEGIRRAEDKTYKRLYCKACGELVKGAI